MMMQPGEEVGSELRKQDGNDALERKERELRNEIARLAKAIARLEDSDALIEELRSREAELRQISSAKSRDRHLTEEEIRAYVTGSLADVTKLFKKEPQLAKSNLAEHMEPIRLLPQPDGTYIAEGEWGLLGNRRPVLVAGAGFEPATFGLFNN